MRDEPDEFQWQVAEGGYKWVSVLASGLNPPPAPGSPMWRSVEPKEYLTNGISAGRPYPARRYYPLRECPELFKTFADLEPNRESILSFSNRYGMLGGGGADFGIVVDGITYLLETDSPVEADVSATIIIESFDRWEREIQRMRLAVAVWEAARRSDIEALQRMIHCEKQTHEPSGQVYYTVAPRSEDHAFCSSNSLQVWSELRDDYLDPALRWLHDTINRGLSQYRLVTRLWRDRDGNFSIAPCSGKSGHLHVAAARTGRRREQGIPSMPRVPQVVRRVPACCAERQEILQSQLQGRLPS